MSSLPIESTVPKADKQDSHCLVQRWFPVKKDRLASIHPKRGLSANQEHQFVWPRYLQMLGVQSSWQ